MFWGYIYLLPDFFVSQHIFKTNKPLKEKKKYCRLSEYINFMILYNPKLNYKKKIKLHPQSYPVGKNPIISQDVSNRS